MEEEAVNLSNVNQPPNPNMLKSVDVNRQRLLKERSLQAHLATGKYEPNARISHEEVNQLQENGIRAANKTPLKAVVALSNRAVAKDWNSPDLAKIPENERIGHWKKGFEKWITETTTQLPHESIEKYLARMKVLKAFKLNLHDPNSIKKFYKKYCNNPSDKWKEKSMEKFHNDAVNAFKDEYGVDAVEIAGNSELIEQISEWAFGSTTGKVTAKIVELKGSARAHNYNGFRDDYLWDFEGHVDDITLPEHKDERDILDILRNAPLKGEQKKTPAAHASPTPTKPGSAPKRPGPPKPTPPTVEGKDKKVIDSESTNTLPDTLRDILKKAYEYKDKYSDIEDVKDIPNTADRQVLEVLADRVKEIEKYLQVALLGESPSFTTDSWDILDNLRDILAESLDNPQVVRDSTELRKEYEDMRATKEELPEFDTFVEEFVRLSGLPLDTLRARYKLTPPSSSPDDELIPDSSSHRLPYPPTAFDASNQDFPFMLESVEDTATPVGDENRKFKDKTQEQGEEMAKLLSKSSSLGTLVKKVADGDQAARIELTNINVDILLDDIFHIDRSKLQEILREEPKNPQTYLPVLTDLVANLQTMLAKYEFLHGISESKVFIDQDLKILTDSEDFRRKYKIDAVSADQFMELYIAALKQKSQNTSIKTEATTAPAVDYDVLKAEQQSGLVENEAAIVKKLSSLISNTPELKTLIEQAQKEFEMSLEEDALLQLDGVNEEMIRKIFKIRPGRDLNTASDYEEIQLEGGEEISLLHYLNRELTNLLIAHSLTEQAEVIDSIKGAYRLLDERLSNSDKIALPQNVNDLLKQYLQALEERYNPNRRTTANQSNKTETKNAAVSFSDKDLEQAREVYKKYGIVSPESLLENLGISREKAEQLIVQLIAEGLISNNRENQSSSGK